MHLRMHLRMPPPQSPRMPPTNPLLLALLQAVLATDDSPVLSALEEEELLRRTQPQGGPPVTGLPGPPPPGNFISIGGPGSGSGLTGVQAGGDFTPADPLLPLPPGGPTVIPIGPGDFTGTPGGPRNAAGPPVLAPLGPAPNEGAGAGADVPQDLLSIPTAPAPQSPAQLALPGADALIDPTLSAQAQDLVNPVDPPDGFDAAGAGINPLLDIFLDPRLLEQLRLAALSSTSRTVRASGRADSGRNVSQDGTQGQEFSPARTGRPIGGSPTFEF